MGGSRMPDPRYRYSYRGGGGKWWEVVGQRGEDVGFEGV